jgi:hypothetical protein
MCVCVCVCGKLKGILGSSIIAHLTATLMWGFRYKHTKCLISHSTKKVL